ncbi:MAG: hypothetical protein AB8B63_04795 [Granulosicoccus sp.]
MVAGYGSWAMTSVNPASEAVAALGRSGADTCHLHCLEAPVDSEGLYEWLERTIEQYKPDIWIGVGVAVGRPSISVENIAINVRRLDVPDNKGLRLGPSTIIDGGPAAYQSNLKHDDIVRNLQGARIPAILSYHAGTHLCNQMLYSIMHIREAQGLNLLGGFIHVPQSTDNVSQALGADVTCSSMSIPMMTQALAITLDSSLGQLDAAATYA